MSDPVAIDLCRREVIEAADAERARLVAGLRDGAQRQVVNVLLALQLAQRALEAGDGSARGLLDEAVEQAEGVRADLRALSAGTVPAALGRSGLGAAVAALAGRLPVPVTVRVSVGRLAPELERHAYFIVAEALTNAARHARARSVELSVTEQDDSLLLEVRDDGRGGATVDQGSGLAELEMRVLSLDGALRIDSPRGDGTVVLASIPLAA